MIAFITLCYCGLIWLIFFKFKLLPWNRISQVASAVIGILAVGELLILIGLYQPYSTQAIMVNQVTPIVARVSGRVVEVPVEPNAPVKQGDVLMRIDPAPYAATVASLEAQLAGARQDVLRLKAAWDGAKADLAKATANQTLAKIELDAQTELVAERVKAQREVDRWRARYDSATAAVALANAEIESARLAYESEIDGENTTVARIRADLDAARIDLAETTIYAPSDGYVTSLFVRPGAMALTATSSSLMSFVDDSTVEIIGTFPQSSIRHVRIDDPVEFALDTQPGKIFNGRVAAVLPATEEGAVSPSGDLIRATDAVQKGPVVITFSIDEDLSDVQSPLGATGAAAIYTEKGAALRIIRRVIIRMYTWLNFLP